MATYSKIKFDRFIKIGNDFEKLPLKRVILASLIINVSILILSLVAQIILPPIVPMFFGLPQTEEQLVPSILIGLPQIVSIVFILINTLISINIDGQYIKKMLAFTSLSLTILSTVATLKVIFLVGTF